MVGLHLPQPVLCIALDAVENIQDNEETVGALWSVFSRCKDVIENGHRLENMSWRLWHHVRVSPTRPYASSLPARLPSYPPALPRPLSSPSLSFSSSSEGTATSSEWERDTAVEDDEIQGLHASGARRNTVVSPLAEKARLDISAGACVAQAPASHLLAPAPSSHRSHQHDSGHGDADLTRQLPSSVASDSTPHHPPQADTDAGTDVSYERVQGTSLSVSLHQCANRAPTIAGLKDPSSPHVPKSPHTFHTQRLAASDIDRSTTSGTEILASTITSSSMPITLPSLVGPRKDALFVGRMIADLFPEKRGNSTVRNMEGKVQSQGVSSNGAQGRISVPAPAEQTVLPQIVEPQPSTPAAGRTWFGNPTPSTTTSATSTPRQAFPTVVVVNPTPHPTPPATPCSAAPDAPFGLRPTATPFDRPDRSAEGWSGAENGQLATPVSLNGDARSPSPVEPKFVMVDPPKPQDLQQFLNTDVTALPLQTSLLPATAITLPERPSDTVTSHLPTPSSNPHSEMVNSSKSTTAPIPAPAAVEDKKFFLAAPHSSSGHESSESPDSLGMGSVSPQKAGQLGGKDGVPLLQSVLSREEDVASSFSAGSPGGRPPSVTSSKGHKQRVGFSVASGSRRRQVPKKTTIAAKQPSRKDADLEAKEAEREVKSKEIDERTKSKGKERAVGERSDVPKPGPSTSAEQPATSIQTQQKHQPLHRPSAPQPQPQNLRQLPTNPPRQQAQPPVRHSGSDVSSATARPNAGQPPTARLPFHPQLGHLGLAHLPTVPPRQRRPIEITTESSEYETTDTDESSWESESLSGEETGEGEGRSRPTRAGGERSRSSGGNTASRTRDAGEFQRDAEREAQRARELFQKLPSRSYSHLAQLPRVKSGLSMLFQPDPQLFPDGHPYRTSHSSRDILARNWSAPAPPQAMIAMTRRGAPAGAAVSAESAVAGANAGSSTQRPQQRGAYQRRGPPQGQEHETDSGDEDPEDTIQVSSSVAQRRLAVIMGKRPAQQSQSQSQRPSPTRSTSHSEPAAQAPDTQSTARAIAAPVLMHPYLPDPAPLQTPHTVRRNIISQELDEELRRNLLWERSQNQIQGRPPRAAGSILPGPWRPLTALRPEESRETQSNTSDKGPGKRSFATQRTKSWAGDYHAAGW